MYRKNKLILSLVGLLLLISTIAAFSQSTYAYPGGLLDKKEFYASSNINEAGLQTWDWTDGDTGTNSILNSMYRYGYHKFKAPVTINSYQLKTVSPTTSLNIEFYDANKNLISSVNSADVSNEKVTLPVVEGVYLIALHNVSPSTSTNLISVSEFEVYGSLTPSTTPTTEPTVAPTITPTSEPTPEPTPTATPEIPSGDRALLNITLITGTDKEFDLSMSEVNAFLNWYDSASGSLSFGINKHNNNKGPFINRTEYVIHDKILTFEVSEYTAQ